MNDLISHLVYFLFAKKRHGKSCQSKRNPKKLCQLSGPYRHTNDKIFAGGKDDGGNENAGLLSSGAQWCCGVSAKAGEAVTFLFPFFLEKMAVYMVNSPKVELSQNHDFSGRSAVNENARTFPPLSPGFSDVFIFRVIFMLNTLLEFDDTRLDLTFFVAKIKAYWWFFLMRWNLPMWIRFNHVVWIQSAPLVAVLGVMRDNALQTPLGAWPKSAARWCLPALRGGGCRRAGSCSCSGWQPAPLPGMCSKWSRCCPQGWKRAFLQNHPRGKQGKRTECEFHT